MGKHYVPQEYLRGFASPGERTHVWMFDAQTSLWSHAAIKQVAQEGDYYPPEVESRLAHEVETPGHEALSVLRTGGQLSASQREALGYYVAVMVVRGPKKRRLGRELAPRALRSTIDELKDAVRQTQEKHDSPRVRELLADAERLEQKFRAALPTSVTELIQSPWPTSEVIAAVQGMIWRIVRVPNSAFLITSDSPAFFFEEYGLGTALAELAFPIDAKLALLGSHQGDRGGTFYLPGKPAVVKEVNRRIAAGAERFVFAPKKERWIETLALRRHPHLSRIGW